MCELDLPLRKELGGDRDFIQTDFGAATGSPVGPLESAAPLVSTPTRTAAVRPELLPRGVLAVARCSFGRTN